MLYVMERAVKNNTRVFTDFCDQRVNYVHKNKGDFDLAVINLSFVAVFIEVFTPIITFVHKAARNLLIDLSI